MTSCEIIAHEDCMNGSCINRRMSSSPAQPMHFSLDYALSLLSALHGQLKTKLFCDITLGVGGRQFQAHRNILAAASPYFHVMFTGGLSESESSVIHIQGASPQIFEILLKFMYTGDIDITAESCQDLLSAADLIQLTGVLDACCLFLQQQLHPSNCLGIYQLSEAHCCTDLSRFSEEYIYTNFLEVIKQDEFHVLPKDLLLKLVSSELVHIDSEIQMLDAILDWIKHDVIKRRTCVFELLTVIRFPLIPKSILDKCVDGCHDLSLKIAVRKTAQDFDMDRKSAQMAKLRTLQPFLFQDRKGARRKFLIVGGIEHNIGKKWSDSQTLASVEIFDVHKKTSSEVTSLKYSRSAHAMAVVNGLVYVIGGEKDLMIYDSVECYDPTRNEWSTVGSLTEPRCGLGAAVVDDCIYVIGGWVGSKIGRTIEMFDPQFNVWTVVDEMRKPRYQMGVVAHEGLIYIIGGCGDMGTEERTVESYNPITKNWCRLADLLPPQTQLAACVGEDMIYVVGGMNDEDGTMQCVQGYDIFQDKWSVITKMTNPCAGPMLTYLSGCLYVLGGRSSSTIHNSKNTVNNIDCYNINDDCWESVEPMCSGRWLSTIVLL